jgi:aldose 1-epimerase
MKNLSYQTHVINDMKVMEVILQNDLAKVVLLSYGAGIYQYQYESQDLVIKPKTIKDYMNDLVYYGKTIGRTSGRLVVPSYDIGSHTYQVKPFRSKNTSLHGGEHGFAAQNFELINVNDQKLSATFRYVSKDLEEGYPGKLTLDVCYQLNDDGSIEIYHDAITTKDTLCNITNHVYFNLNQKIDHIYDHILEINAPSYLDIDETYMIKSVNQVDSSPFDFRKPVKLKDQMSKMKHTSFQGFDHTFILDETAFNIPKAVAYEKSSNIGIKAYTTYPAIVFYTHNDPAGIDLEGPFKGDALHCSFTLECQFEPGGIHHPYLNQAILKKDEIYHHVIKFEPFRK